MNQKALKTLEFDKIIHILTAHAASEGAKEMCRKLVPYDNINDVERAQRETADALRRVYRKGSVSFGGIRDIRGSLKRGDRRHSWNGRITPDHVTVGNCRKDPTIWTAGG